MLKGGYKLILINIEERKLTVFSIYELLKKLNQSFYNTDLYTTVEDGIIFIRTNNNPILKLSVFVVPIKETHTIYKKDLETSINFLFYKNGEQYPDIKIKSTKLFCEKTYISRFGIKSFAEFGKNEWNLFFSVIRILIKNAETKTIYSTLGWVDSKKYLYGSLMITPDSIENINNNLIKNQISIVEPTTDIYSEIEYIVDNLCSDRFITHTMLSFYFLSLLKPEIINFSGTCPSFALAIIGKSGSGKTSTVMPLMNPLDLKNCCFEDSQASIRRTFQENFCGCTIIDDFKCNSTNNNNKFEEIIRLAGDLTSNGRRVINQKIEDITVTGMAVFTGETIPKIQASSFPRLLILEIEANSINFDTLSILIEKINYYILFICKFIQYIMKNNNFYNEFIEKFQEERQNCRKKYKEYALHPRYYDIYSWLVVTYRYINDFCDNRLINSYSNYENELITRITKQNNRFDPDPIKIFIKTFFILKNMNEFIIKDYQEMKNGDDFDVCCTDDYFILKSGTVYKKIVDYCSVNKIDFPYLERKLRDELHSKGILEKNGKYNTYEIKTRHGNGIRVYNIKKNALLNFGGIYNE